MAQLKSTEVPGQAKGDWRRHEPKSFEVTEYGKNKMDDGAKKYSIIREIVRDIALRTPAHGFQVSMGGGGILKLMFVCYEMQLPRRLSLVQNQAKQLLDEAVKEIKKQYKERTGKTLSLEERKELANFAIEKVSLNERYYYNAWRCYEMTA